MRVVSTLAVTLLRVMKPFGVVVVIAIVDPPNAGPKLVRLLDIVVPVKLVMPEMFPSRKMSSFPDVTERLLLAPITEFKVTVPPVEFRTPALLRVIASVNV